jgi:hypothetical protein
MQRKLGSQRKASRKSIEPDLIGWKPRGNKTQKWSKICEKLAMEIVNVGNKKVQSNCIE